MSAEPDLLTEYLRLLRGDGREIVPEPPGGRRTCPNCGATAPFHVEAVGGWARCPACGRYA